MMKDSQPPNRQKSFVLVSILFCLSLIAAACGSSADSTTAAESADAEVEETAEAEVAEDTEDTEEEPADSDDEHDDSDEHDDADDDDHAHDENGDHTDEAVDGQAVNLDLFINGAIISDVVTADCTLSGGTETQCHTFTVTGFPITYDTGPFCPTTIDATADEVGLWLDGENLYSVDGEFITSLAEIYQDDFWMLHNEDGTVNVTETAEEFKLAAVPQVDESLLNHCVEGRVEWLENGEPVTSEITIPVTPVLADGSSTGGNWGVTLDGVSIAAGAPVDAILGNYTIAAFDPCGGHYNPFEGYHVHAATGCSETGDVIDGETPMFAIAMDGFPIHSEVDDDHVGDLDECNGHVAEGIGYHYHANPAEDNGVLTCFMGETASSGDAGGGGGRGGPPPDGERPEGPPPGAEE